MDISQTANKYIDEKMPWALAKEPERKAELDTVMHNLAEAIRIISILIEPFMHTTSKEIRKNRWDYGIRRQSGRTHLRST